MSRTTRAVGGLLALTLLAACTPSTDAGDKPAATPTAPTPGLTRPAVEQDLDLAVSTPVEDSVYPQVGDPGVDALLYDLDVTWKPKNRRLVGRAEVTFRATRTARRFQLDLSERLGVTSVILDGATAKFRHRGKNLVVKAEVEADERYVVAVTYSGEPGPVTAPTSRGDLSTIGLTVTDDGELWTMQEPFGAYTWYPVNDQPSDKALYDVTIHVRAPWTGVSNGHLVTMETAKKVTTTSWQLTEPAASYLTTLVVGDYTHSSDVTASGLRVDYWTPRGMTQRIDELKSAADSVDWIEQKLGPYPFDSLGLVVTESQSAMETQTMLTMGTSDYILSPAVITHELVHQWYGDQVSPADWRDVWMSEGMTMLMQWLYEDEHGISPLENTLALARTNDQSFRNSYGPPGDYDPQQFGSNNIYHLPALMWNELREELGDEEFYRIARSWLAEQDNTSSTREQLYAHWQEETGRDLSAFFDAWVSGATTPAPGLAQR